MEVKFNIPEVMGNIEDRLRAGLDLSGALLVAKASDQLRANGSVVTGNLVNSLNHATDKKAGTVTANTDGGPIEQPITPLTCRAGSNVVYARRVEMGFVGKDSLGRVYNQMPKSYLRAALETNKAAILAILKRAVNG